MAKRGISLATGMFLLAKAQAFTSPTADNIASIQNRISHIHMVPPDEPAGSFFHQVPDDNDKKDDNIVKENIVKKEKDKEV